jgi:glycosyltransferase involved in cell wall biosynthesis
MPPEAPLSGAPGANAEDLAVSVVIPVFDEEESVGPLHAALKAALVDHRHELIFVNDGSGDGSAQVLDALAAKDSATRIIHFVRNYGQTAALTAGIRAARAPALVTMDADGQNDPADIPMLLEKLSEADVVCGWRKDRKDRWITRTLPSKVANALISRLSKVPLHDYGCTLRAYKRRYIEDIPLYGEMHRFIPIYVTWAGATITEVPVRHHARTRGTSKYGLARIPKVLLDLTTLKFLRDFFVTPIYFFGWVGMLLVMGGLASGVVAVAFWGPLERPLLASSLTVVAPMLVIFGVVEITLGIIAEVLIRMHFEIQGKTPYRIKGGED